MKLNYKRTVLVGFAFFLIWVFSQAYESLIPLILTHKFEMSQTASGFVMSLDNILAVVLLPVFGNISDKISTRIGRRTPFVLIGTVIAAVAFAFLGYIDSLPIFIAVLIILLLAISSFRSPAVALMPDVTVKPLRSKGNAIINLMGALGGVVALVIGKVIGIGDEQVSHTSVYPTYILVISAVMLISLAVFLLTVRENKWAAEMEEDTKRLGCDAEAEEREEGGRLSRGQLVSLIFLLASVMLWYIGYNAVTSKYSVYAQDYLKVDFTMTLLIANAAAIVTYIPVGFLASRFGRKRMILVGVAILAVAFGAASFVKEGVSPIVMSVVFVLAGIGWATINVNSFPMVVELAKAGDVGKYTGYYYTASMLAQIVTPVFSGYLMDKIDLSVMFPYAAVFVVLSGVTMLFVKHGDSKPERVKDLLESFDTEG